MTTDTEAGPVETELSARMRRLAKERNDLPDNWLDLADAFDEATAGFFGTPRTVDVAVFMGCFARARRAWCSVTGEPLV